MATGLETRWLREIEVQEFLGKGNRARRVLYSTMRKAWRAPDGARYVFRLAAARFSAADLPRRSSRDCEIVAASVRRTIRPSASRRVQVASARSSLARLRLILKPVPQRVVAQGR